MSARIIIFGDDPTGPTGFGKVVANLTLAVRRAGLEPVVVGLKRHYETAAPPARVVNAAQQGDARGFETLGRVLQEQAAQALISIGDPWDVLGIPALRERAPFRWIAYTPVDSLPYPRHVLLARDPHHYLDVAALLRQADAIVTFSRFGADAIVRMLREASGLLALPPVEHIPLGVDTERFSPRPKAEAREVFQGITLDDEALLLSCMKVNSLRAGFDTLLAAWARALEMLRERQPSLARSAQLYLHTSIAGGAYPLLVLMQRYGLQDHLVLNPQLGGGELIAEEDIALIHSASDVVLSAARGEGFGLNILEALSCGVPCVVPDYGAPAEYGGDAVARVPIAACFNPEFAVTDFAIADVEAMARAIVELALDPARRARMGAEGRRIAETLTWDAFAARWARVLGDAVGR